MEDVEFTAFMRKRYKEAKEAGERMFFGVPDNWYEPPGPKWRCKNGHISRRYLKSEQYKGDVCLACFSPVMLTDPKDEEKADK